MELSFNKKILVGVFVIVGGLLMMGFGAEQSLALAVVNTGVIITIASYAASVRKDKVLQDERTKRLGAKAASYSWMVTYVLVALLVWWFEYTDLVMSLEAVMGILLFEMTMSMLGFRWWFNRKGE